ncbi:MAG: NB-ARC domain-containing protein [Bacteroidota bacterium]
MSNKLSQFWQELKRRKVIYFLIGYVAASFAIIEFFDITKDTFAIPQNTLKLLYVLAAIGLPVVIILPWIINRKKTKESEQDPALQASPEKEEKKPLHNLPAQLTSFIGREKEMQVVKEFITEHRLVTLTGSGGCGKTRLAIELATQLISDFKDGIWFVDLSPISDENLVVKEIMEVLKIAEVANQTFEETLIGRIKEKNLLIILDNCEHLLKASADITRSLMQSVPNIKVLATSREALGMIGEKVWRIPSLTLLDPKAIINLESVKESEAVLLFNDRARLNNPEFELEIENITEVVTICNKVDGIPLAVELVASRTRHMNPKVILERFADRLDQLSSADSGKSKRQQTLQSTIEWSYNLLSEEETALFNRLSVFMGGFDLMAVEEVCVNEHLPREKILDLLSHLVDRSMIQRVYQPDQQMRYRLLETLQRFASNILVEKGEAAETRKRHIEYFIRIAEQAYDERMTSQAKWVYKIRLEHNNMLAALGWAELHDPDTFSVLAANLSWYWGRSNDYSMAIEILEKVITSEIGDREIRARLDTGYGSLLATAGDLQKALNLLKHGLSLWRELENKKEEALILAALSDLVYGMGDNEGGLKYANEGYAVAIELNDPGVELFCMTMVSYGFVAFKNTEEARPMCRKVLKMAEELENLYMIFVAHHMLGDCELIDGLYNESEREYGEGVKTTLKSGDTAYTCVDMCGVAMSLAGQGRYTKALRINAAATSKAKSFGSWIPEDIPIVFWHELVIQLIAGTREKLGEELTQKYEEEGRSMSFEEAVEYALDFEKD